MSYKSIALAATIMTLSPALLAGTAYAEKGGHGHGKDKGRSHHSERYDGKRHYDDRVVIIRSDRDIIRNYIYDDYRAHCPPGLAKKNNGCQPPGQAKKKYIIGYPLPRDAVIIPISNDLRRHLQPIPRGYNYVRVDNDVLLIAEASKKVIDAVTLLSAVGN